MQRSPVTAPTLARLIDAFHRLPGIGPKSAQRLAYHILRAPRSEAEALADALLEVKDRTILCGVCQNITDADPCAVCADPNRAAETICVVEEPLDIVAIERTGAHRGRYHVLHGAISPMDGIGPEDLKVRELLARLGDHAVQEVILATNPNLEGEATAGYLTRVIGAMGVRITRLAHGLPLGADVEYADERTLREALTHRVRMDGADGSDSAVGEHSDAGGSA